MAKIRKNRMRGVRFPAGMFPGSVIAKITIINIADATNSPVLNYNTQEGTN